MEGEEAGEGNGRTPLLDAESLVEREGHESESDASSEVAAESTVHAVLEIFRGAWPQMTVIFARTAINATDVAVVGKLGTDELAAAAFANIWIQLTAVIIWASNDGVIALTSQARGAGNTELVGAWLAIGMGCVLIVAIPIGASWCFLGKILAIVPVPSAEHSEDNMLELASQFGRLSALWIVPEALTSCFGQWINGMDAVTATVPVHLFFVLYNLLANLVLVHGVDVGGQTIGGLGFKGSPLATASTSFLRLIALVQIMRSRLPASVWEGFALRGFTRDRVKSFMEQSLPNVVVAVLEQLQFMIMTLMVAHFGESQLAAHSAMMNVFDLFACSLLGCMEGGSMKIGKALGAGRPMEARGLSKILFACMSVLGVIVACLFLGLKDVIGRVFSDDDDVVHFTSQLSLLDGAAFAFLSVSFGAYGVLQGQGRPNKAAVSLFAGVWGVGLPSSYVLGFPLHVGFLGVWYGCIAGYVVMTCVMLGQLYHSDWDALSVAARERSEMTDVLVCSPALRLPSPARRPRPSPQAPVAYDRLD